MSAENGIPVDKCPKCGMVENDVPNIGNRTKYFCGSIAYVADFMQSTACKRIAELQAEVERRAETIAELICELEIKDELINKLRGDKCPEHG